MQTRKLLPFQNVVADGKAILELELGPTYHRINVALGGTALTKTMLARIVAKLNGTIIFDLTGDQLDTINKYRSLADAAGYLTIDFTETQTIAANLAGMRAGRVPTGKGCTSFILEVDIAGATAPTLQGYAEVSGPEALTADSSFLCMIPQGNNFSSTGKFPIVLPSGPSKNTLMKRAHFFGGSPTELTAKIGSVAVFDEIPVAVAQHLQKERERVPQAGHFCFDPIVNGDLQQVMDMAAAQQVSMHLTVGATGVVTTVLEGLATLGSL